MKNIIILDEIPDNKAAFLIGTIIGLGLSFKIAPKSPMYRVLREKKRQRYHEEKERRDGKLADFWEDGYRLYISGQNKEDIKVNVTRG